MTWEILAIWAIVMGAIAWFVHDERQQRRAQQNGRVQRFMANPAPVPAQPAAPMNLGNDSAEAIALRQRFVEALRKNLD